MGAPAIRLCAAIKEKERQKFLEGAVRAGFVVSTADKIFSATGTKRKHAMKWTEYTEETLAPLVEAAREKKPKDRTQEDKLALFAEKNKKREEKTRTDGGSWSKKRREKYVEKKKKEQKEKGEEETGPRSWKRRVKKEESEDKVSLPDASSDPEAMESEDDVSLPGAFSDLEAMEFEHEVSLPDASSDLNESIWSKHEVEQPSVLQAEGRCDMTSKMLRGDNRENPFFFRHFMAA